MGGLINSGHMSKAGYETLRYNVTFTPPVIEEEDNYARVFMEGANQVLMQANQPLLPMFSDIIKIPFGSQFIDIQTDVLDVYKVSLGKKILPANNPIPVKHGITQDEEVKDFSYQGILCYPEQWYQLTQGVGIEQGKRFLFLSLQVYPVRYLPGADQLQYITNMEFK